MSSLPHIVWGSSALANFCERLHHLDQQTTLSIDSSRRQSLCEKELNLSNSSMSKCMSRIVSREKVWHSCKSCKKKVTVEVWLQWPESCAVNTLTIWTFYPVVLFLWKQELTHTLSHKYCEVRRYACWAFYGKNKQRYGMKLDCHLPAWLHTVPHEKTCLKNKKTFLWQLFHVALFPVLIMFRCWCPLMPIRAWEQQSFH